MAPVEGHLSERTAALPVARALRPADAAAAGLVLLAILLPPGAMAAALVGPDSPLVPEVARGLWSFKVLLALHGVALFGFTRLRPAAQAPAGALAPLAAPADAMRRSAAAAAAVAALLAIGALLRVYDLGNGLWYDEIRTLVTYARRPLAEIVAIYDSQNQHLLYSLLARGTVIAFGESAWSLRLPAALLGIGSLGALYWFARQVVDRREALLATAFLTFSYHHVWFSQNARGYTGLLLGTLIATGLLVRLLARPGERVWPLALGYAAALALAAYTHVTAALIAIGHALVWGALVWGARRRGCPIGEAGWAAGAAFLLAGTFTLQLYAPVLPQFFDTLAVAGMPGAETAWKNPLWMVAETLRGLGRGVPGGWAALAVGGVVGVAGVVDFWRQSRTLVGLMLAPAALTAAALVATDHNLWPRFFFFSAGFGVLIVVRGISALARAALAGGLGARRAAAVATAATLVAVAASATTVPGAWNPKQDYAGARDFVEARRAPGDAVVTVDMSAYAFQAFGVADWIEVESLAELEAVERGHRRTWIVYMFPTRLAAVQPEIWERLEARYAAVAEFPGTLGDGAIVVKASP